MGKSKKNKSKRKTKHEKMTTSEALESLLGKKAAKRLRRLAIELAEAERKGKPKSKKKA
jgi:hypothetical protein